MMERQDLSDDHGDLRPEVARAIARDPERPPAPRPTPIQPPPLGIRPDEVMRLAQQFRDLLERVPRLVLLALVVVLFVLTLARGCNRRSQDQLVPAPAPPPQTVVVREVTPAPPPPDAMVLAERAVLHAAPGPDQGEVGAAARGEPLFVLDRTVGWIRVRTEAGVEGWLFAGELLDRRGSGRPGIILSPLYRDDDLYTPAVTAGTRVLLEQVREECAIALLPDGTRLSVPRSAVLVE